MKNTVVINFIWHLQGKKSQANEVPDAELRAIVLACIEDMRWTASNRLQLNPSKTEFFWCTTIRRLHLIDSGVFLLAGGDVTASASVILGHTGTSTATWVWQHTSTISSADHSMILSVTSYQNYPSISTHRDSHHTRHINSYVISRGDYCNSLLHGLPAYQLTRVQSILNTAARMIQQHTIWSYNTTLTWPTACARTYQLQACAFWCTWHSIILHYSVSQKNPPLRTCGNFSKTVGNFSTKFYMPIMHSYLR